MTRPPINLAASIRARLQKVAMDRRASFEFILVRYATERFLYRLGQSQHGQSFILKGATLFALWGGPPHRATRDVDFLVYGDASSDRVKELLQSVLAVPSDDGLLFDLAALRIEPITAIDEYGGWRVKFFATLDGARIPLQVDVATGDAVTPAPMLQQMPVLLDHPAPSLRIYPVESVISEKYQAIVSLGMVNSRLKDYFDLWYISQHQSVDASMLQTAIAATFSRRRTLLPEQEPDGLSDAYALDVRRAARWKNFCTDQVEHPQAPTLHEAVIEIRRLVQSPPSTTRGS